jgi:hypothetical protein
MGCSTLAVVYIEGLEFVNIEKDTRKKIGN